jgi:uncharacterized Zn finger protein (UPF0148 family)
MIQLSACKCGTVPEYARELGRGNAWLIVCPHCGHTGDEVYSLPERAAAAWNEARGREFDARLKDRVERAAQSVRV